MAKLPLKSSADIIRTLKRFGFSLRGKHGGSHRAYTKEKPGGGHWLAIVADDRKEMPRGLLKEIIAQSGIAIDEFLKELDD